MSGLCWPLLLEDPSVLERYDSYRSGLVCWKFSSSGPRFEHRSAATGLGVDSAGDQCAAEGVKTALAGVSATIVQRQCVRVGAADVVDRRSVVAKSGNADVKSILVVCKACSDATKVRVWLYKKVHW